MREIEAVCSKKMTAKRIDEKHVHFWERKEMRQPKVGLGRFNINFLAFCLTFMNGCSFLFVSPPPEAYQAMPYFDCTTNVAAPVIDTLLALGDTAAIGINAPQDVVDGPIIAGNAIGAVLFGIAAGYGFVETGKCSKAKAEWAYHHATPATQQLLPHVGGCERDTDCKGDRVCGRGMCITPPTATPDNSTPTGAYIRMP